MEIVGSTRLHLRDYLALKIKLSGNHTDLFPSSQFSFSSRYNRVRALLLCITGMALSHLIPGSDTKILAVIFLSKMNF